jgi:hypothetical protein
MGFAEFIIGPAKAGSGGSTHPTLTESIDYSSATKPDAFTIGPQRSKSALMVAAN